MRAVRSRDTGPELLVRQLLRRLGFAFRLQDEGLTGRPDFVLPKHKAVVFVHGCFWHGHTCVRGDRVPVSNRIYWVEKINRNRTRDARVRRTLRAEGWRVVTIWECQLKRPAKVENRIRALMS